MRVSDPGHGADLALEALQETGQADKLRRQDLDRDLLAAAALGDAAIHAAPRALAQLLDQSKPADLPSRQVAAGHLTDPSNHVSIVETRLLPTLTPTAQSMVAPLMAACPRVKTLLPFLFISLRVRSVPDPPHLPQLVGVELGGSDPAQEGLLPLDHSLRGCRQLWRELVRNQQHAVLVGMDQVAGMH